MTESTTEQAAEAKPTCLVVLLDRSGSMHECKSDMEGGFREFLAEQRKVPGECRISLFQFSEKFEIVYSDQPIAEAPDLVLHPHGMTALLDAIGETVEIIDGHLKCRRLVDRPEPQVILAIITDGKENSSKEYTLPVIKKLLEDRTAAGWEITYLGANQDAISVAQSMGIQTGSALSYHTGNAQATYSTLGGAVTRNRTMGENISYTPQERAAVVEDTDKTNQNR